MSDLLNMMMDATKNEDARRVGDGVIGDVNGFVDTGSYTFNALLSGSLWGGIPDNKILAIAGESATGKTYFTIEIVKKFLSNNEDGVVLYFDSEQAVTSDMFLERGVDPDRIAVFPIDTVENFRSHKRNLC